MLVSVGGAWLIVFVLLVLASEPGFRLAAAANAAADNITAAQRPQQQMRLQQLSSSQDADLAPQDSSVREQFVTEDIQVGCRELRAKRYISDGFCTSTKPIKEVVCAGSCLPIMDLPWYAEFVKVWAKAKLREWQCEEDIVKRKSVHLLCRNGQYRKYVIKVVKSCKCKRKHVKHNKTGTDSKSKPPKRKGKSDDNRRKGEVTSRKDGASSSQSRQAVRTDARKKNEDASEENVDQDSNVRVRRSRGRP